MKKTISLILLLLCPLALYCTDWKFEFSNGDSIRGDSLSVSPDAKLSIRTLTFERQYITASLKDMTECSRDNGNPQKGSFRLTLRNADSFQCDLDGIKDGMLSVRSDAFGKIQIPLTSILEFRRPSELAKGNSEKLDCKNAKQWKVLPAKFADRISFYDGMMLLRGPIIAFIPCPYEKFKISFSAMLNLDYGLNLLFYAKLDKNESEGYVANLLPYSVTLSKKTSKTEQQIGNKQLNEVQSDSSVIKFNVFADRENGVFNIKLNDETSFTFTDKDLLKPSGNYIAFSCPQNFAIISKLEISEWDSILNSNSCDTLNGNHFSAPNYDIIFMKNQDSMKGTLVDIHSEKINFKTDFGNLDVPSERIAKIAMREMPIRDENKDGDTNTTSQQISFNNGDTLKIVLEKIDDKTIFATHPILGKLNLALDYVVKISSSMGQTEKEKRHNRSIIDDLFNMPNIAMDADTEEELEDELGEIINLLN